MKVRGVMKRINIKATPDPYEAVNIDDPRNIEIRTTAAKTQLKKKV